MNVSQIYDADEDFCRNAADYIALNSDYLRWKISTGRFLYIQMDHAVRLADNAMRNGIAECIADGPVARIKQVPILLHV